MRLFGLERAFGAIAVVAVISAGLVASPPAKADLATISMGLADAACRARAGTESHHVYQQYPDVGIETFWSVYWSCRLGR